MTATIHRLHQPITSDPVSAFCQPCEVVASDGVEVAQCQQIILALCVFASRHGLPDPSDEALMLDAEAIASWPTHLWHKAYRQLWQTWTYRRMPTVGDFRTVIAADLSSPAATPGSPRPSVWIGTATEGATQGPGGAGHGKPVTVEDCVLVLQSASTTAPGLLAKWWRAACNADPTLTKAEFGSIPRWAPLVAERIGTVGLLGPVC